MVHGMCRLHNGVANLRDSHIIPNWAYNRTRGPGGNHTVAFMGDCVMIDSRHITEYLLCGTCEQRLGVWDGYAARMSCKDSSFPALEAAEPIENMGGDGATLPGVDTNALAKFGVAVFWRASVSSKFPRVKLGQHENALRDYLLGKAKFPRRARLILELIRRSPTEPMDQVVIAPEQYAGPDGYDLLHFATFGLRYTLFVGRRLPPSADELCLVRSQRVLVSDGMDLFWKLAPHMVLAQRKGRRAQADLPIRFSTLRRPPT